MSNMYLDIFSEYILKFAPPPADYGCLHASTYMSVSICVKEGITRDVLVTLQVPPK